MKALIFSKGIAHKASNAPDLLYMSKDNDVLHFLSRDKIDLGTILLPNGFGYGTTGYKVVEQVFCKAQGDKYRQSIANYEPFFVSVRVEEINLESYAKHIKVYNKATKEFDVSVQPIGITLFDSFEAYRQSDAVTA